VCVAIARTLLVFLFHYWKNNIVRANHSNFRIVIHLSIEAVASDFNGSRALSSLDVEGCREERMLRLGSLPKLLQQTKADIQIKRLTIA